MSFPYCPVAIAVGGYFVYPRCREVKDVYTPAAHQRVAMVMPTHRGISTLFMYTILYSRYFSGSKIFVVFVVERRTTKVLSNKNKY